MSVPSPRCSLATSAHSRPSTPYPRLCPAAPTSFPVSATLNTYPVPSAYRKCPSPALNALWLPRNDAGSVTRGESRSRWRTAATCSLVYERGCEAYDTIVALLWGG